MSRPRILPTSTINRVKSMIGTKSLRNIAQENGISFYTAWCIKEGKYDSHLPLQYRRIDGSVFNVTAHENWIA